MRSSPATVRRGEAARLVALPPLRHGDYVLAWRSRLRHGSGAVGAWGPTRPGSFDTLYTFPRTPSVDRVDFEVTLAERDTSGLRLLANDRVRPVTRGFSVALTGR